MRGGGERDGGKGSCCSCTSTRRKPDPLCEPDYDKNHSYREKASQVGGPSRLDISLRRCAGPSDAALAWHRRLGSEIAQDWVLGARRSRGGRAKQSGGPRKVREGRKVPWLFHAHSFWKVQIGAEVGQGGRDTCRPSGHGCWMG
ncbi:hypothetical protein GQ55_2G328900 [Panicum hallii var. hallii]|jgi:hypothetical protein|uniref:Uncharacterized protein n=2 Tax=Panicum hallii TaxID=206008 RepID=A0A2T7EUW5_9POAL|nr:hypothetical protein GQ55_2G328900 [Panicum hallii var. hallii]PVH64706.1 hypothetical protein PAHAL_2G338900 [Panicum hallii]